MSRYSEKKRKIPSKDEEVDDDQDQMIEPMAVGIDIDNVFDITIVPVLIMQSNMQLLSLSLKPSSEEGTPAFHSELSMSFHEWSSLVIAKVAIGATFESTDSLIRIAAEESLLREYSYAQHLGLQAVMLCLQLHDISPVNICHIISTIGISYPFSAPQLWLRLSLNTDAGSLWQEWDKIRRITNHTDRLFLAIEFPYIEESILVTFFNVQVWSAEPIAALIIAEEYFEWNEEKQNHTIQSKNLRRILAMFYDREIHVIVNCGSRGVVQLNPKQLRKYSLALHRLKRIWHNKQAAATLCDTFSFPYRDRLQTPLDPLQDNLDSDTYRIMEQDPVKYQRYEEALIAALLSLKKSLSNGECVNILVVGPGRGPLIESSLLATAVTRCKTTITAIEKNDNAVNTLQSRFAGRGVRIIHGDMREMVGEGKVIPPQTIDIIVSELLGSLGDNEASPECLQQVQIASTTRGVMIPSRYQSAVSLVSSHRLWCDARNMFEHDHHKKDGLDCPYVVNMHSCASLSASQPLFQVHYLTSAVI